MIDWFNGPEPIWHSMWEPMWVAAEENEVALSSISVEQKLKEELPRVSHATDDLQRKLTFLNAVRLYNLNWLL